MEDSYVVSQNMEIPKIFPDEHNFRGLIYFDVINSGGGDLNSKVLLYSDNYARNSYGYMEAKLGIISSYVNVNAEGASIYSGELLIDLNKQKHFKGNFKLSYGMSGMAHIIIR